MLKRLTRTRPVQRALGAFAAAYMRLVARTTRWRVEGDEIAEAAWRGGGLCAVVWHGRLALIYACWPKGWVANPAIVISRSPDGAFVAAAAARLGATVIRGSTRRADRAQKAKGGESAYRHMIRHVQDGGVLCLTPDGPRGPRMRAGAGGARLARQTGASTLCVGVSVKWRIVLGSWDRMLIPLPFGPGAIVWAGPLAPPAAGADVAALRAETEARLIAATARADELAGAPVIAPAPLCAQASGAA